MAALYGYPFWLSTPITLTLSASAERRCRSVQRPRPRPRPRPRSLNRIASDTQDANVKLFAGLYNQLAGRTTETDDMVIRSFEPKEHYAAPKYPIVLCHGLSGFDKLILFPSVYQLTKLIANSIRGNNSELFMENDGAHNDESERALLEVDYWIGVKQALESKGCTVITAKVPGFGSIEERAKVLNAFIEKETGKLKDSAVKQEVYNSERASTTDGFAKQESVKVNLIAHSMGGLDCRYLISKIPNKNYEVMSLTTVSTPHRGSEMADFVVGLFEDLKRELPGEHATVLLPPAFYQLTTNYMKYFNQVTPNDPKVAYFSYGSYFEPKWYNVFYMSWKIIYGSSSGSANDGMVSVASSRWGEYLGSLQNTDHLDIINWKNKLQKELASTLGAVTETGKEQVKPEIDVLEFYLNIADGLARRGF